MAGIRIGHGYDVHRLAEGCRLIIGGVEIPFDKGLSGHSDADVLAHAIMDAILGSLALGDIGKIFPDSDTAYKNADSMELLRRVSKLALERGYVVSNLDSTVLAEKPRLAPYITDMRKKIAQALEAEEDAISVKATTEEGLGFTGALDGIAAHAVVLMERTAI